MYRANDLDGEQNAPQFEHKLTIPVLAVGGEAFFGDEVRHQMEPVAQDVRSVVIERCGHNPSLERPDELARSYLEFFGETVAA